MSYETELRLKIRLTRKLADRMNGVDLSQVKEGDCVELIPAEARLLILEGWAELVDATPVETPVEAQGEPPVSACADESTAKPQLQPEPEPY
jgi:hypothetical protein